MTASASKDLDFQLVTLGVPRLDITERETGAIHSVAPGKSLALITYIAFAPRRTVARDTLCDLLWGDRPVEQSRPLLRQTLWLIKTQICPDCLVATGDNVSLVVPVSCDTEKFTEAIESDDLKLATSLYRGDFFSGYAAPGAGRFEEWANLERTRLRGLFMHAAESLARRLLDSGKFAEAVSLSNRMRSVDPNSQAGWRILLEARIASGDTIAARADADQFEEWLRHEEWEAEPASLVAINAARRTSAAYDSGDGSRELIAELVGREKEFSQIIDAWTAVQNRGARVIQVIGESGAGKTRLTRDILSRIRASRGKSRYVRANFAEREIGFAFAAAIAESLSNAAGAGGVAPAAAKTLVSLNPALSSRYSDSSGPAEPLTPLRVGLALLEMIASIADESPIAIVLDDMHWWDSWSREALTVVASRLSSEKVLLITTSRPQHGVQPISSNAIDIRLHPLSETNIAALVTSLARLPEAEWARRLPGALYSSSGGNPLRAMEALRFAIDAKLLIRSDEQWIAPDPEPLITALEKTAMMERRVATLSPDERAMLLLIGVAGTPVPQSVVFAASHISETHAEQTLASLELRGLVVSEDDTLLPSHDTVGDAITADASVGDMRAARSRLGHAFAASDDVQQRRKSIALLASADEWSDAARNAVPFLKGFASNGPKLDAHLHSLLGSASSPSNTERIRSELPFAVRRPTFFRNALLAIVPVAFVVGGLAIPRLRVAPVPYTEIAVVSLASNGASNIRIAPLDIDRWTPDKVLSFRPHHATISVDLVGQATPRPGSRSWATYAIYPDSGAGEIDLVDIDGHRQRLTFTRGEDRPTSFSPDGRKLLFMTTRWTENGWSDVAILDLVTSRITRITRGDRKYDGAAWSPDGTRIVYSGELPARESNQLCVAHADGKSERCTHVDGWTKVYQVGWADDHRLLLQASDGKRDPRYELYDVDERTVVDTPLPLRSLVHTDPSGLWTIASLVPGQGNSVRLAPTTRLDLSQVISADSAYVFFLAPRYLRLMLDSVAIERRTSPLEPGVPSLLKATGWRHDGTRVTPLASRWMSHTPHIATIDSLGVITPRDTGTAIIEFSAGGWRSVVDTLPVRRTNVRTLLEERWDTLAAGRWKMFGDPPSTIVSQNGFNAFLNNGDGVFFSGAYLRQPIDPSAGIALDFQASTPITRTQWQVLMVGFNPYPDGERFRKWDHRTGFFPGSVDDSESGCWFTYPHGEGEDAVTDAPWFPSLRMAMNDPTFRLDTGRWYKVRLQRFPGGRCGLAINGKAVMITGGKSAPRPMMIMIQGSSVGSRLLAGPLIVQRGVPTDVDWTKLQYNGWIWVNK